MLSSESETLRVFGQVAKREGADCELHPLIHTCLGFILAQHAGHAIPVKIAEYCYSSKSQAEFLSPASKVTSLASGFSQGSPE